MKNGNMPAMPLSGDAYTDFANFDETNNTSFNPECQGLTKREYAAIKIMAGFAADTEMNGPLDCIAENVVAWADALLAELDK